jgi:hypothetical protein
MIDDPIVEEIHKIREKMLEECGGDLAKLFERFRAREAQDQSRVVTSVPKVDSKDGH